MTDCPQLAHAYGPADDIPLLLDRIAREPKAELWSELWSALCHRGSVHPASFAALPWPADVAEGDDREQAVNALALAGSIMAGAEQPHGAGDVRLRRPTEIGRLSTVVNQWLRTTFDRAEYIHLLEAVSAFEGLVGWSEDLAWGLGNEEYEVECPGCLTDLFIVLGERRFFSTSEDYALTDDDVESKPLRPANPADLDGVGRRRHATALSDGHHEVAHLLTYVFGRATCPHCETDFSVADRIG